MKKQSVYQATNPSIKMALAKKNAQQVAKLTNARMGFAMRLASRDICTGLIR